MPERHHNTCLYYHQPASFWEEALPVGNGRIGAMISGKIGQEEIFLNEDTLWSGRPGQFYRDGVAEKIPIARKLIRERRYREADELIEAEILDHDSQSFLPAGKLRIDFHLKGEASGYVRSLNLETAVAESSFQADGIRWKREVFASFPAQVLVFRFSAGKPGALSFDLWFESELPGSTGAAADSIFFNGECPVHNRRGRIVWRDEQNRPGIRYQMRLQIRNQGGRTTIDPAGRFQVSEADSAVLLLAVRSDFVDWKTPPGSRGASPEEKCQADLEKLADRDFESLKREHVADYQSLFLRSILDFPPRTEDFLPTDERLKLAGGMDVVPQNMMALLYHFGRYLLISCSRSGTQAANLQGIWNHLLFPPWGSNYTTNINLEMNYWLSDVGLLPECAEPLYQLIREYSEEGRSAAQSLYHASGWCLHHNGDLWRFASLASGKTRCSFWPVAGAWLCHHIFEHFRFSRDLLFLQKYYDVLRGSAEFLLSLLVEDECGRLVSSPSTSPENSFWDPAAGKSAAAAGSVMDMSLIAENFHSLLQAADLLKKEDLLLPVIRESLKRLKRPRIGSFGELLEYGEALPEIEVNHRHLSHLYGVYPGDEFTQPGKEEILAAARVSLERRGDRSTGWAMGWRAALWARFRDGDHVCRILKNLLHIVEPGSKITMDGGIYMNCFDAHPPFQIDGNFGAAAAIAEMLIQSHRLTSDGFPVIELLPALPSYWPEGRAHGLGARGNFMLDLIWKPGRVKVRIRAFSGGECELRYRDQSLRLTLIEGEEREICLSGDECKKE